MGITTVNSRPSPPHHHSNHCHSIGNHRHRRQRRSWDIQAPSDTFRMERDINIVRDSAGGDNRYRDGSDRKEEDGNTENDSE